MKVLNLYYHLRAVMELCTVCLTDGGRSKWLFIKTHENGFRISPELHKNTVAHFGKGPGRYLILQGLEGFLKCCGEKVPHDGK